MRVPWPCSEQGVLIGAVNVPVCCCTASPPRATPTCATSPPPPPPRPPATTMLLALTVFGSPNVHQGRGLPRCGRVGRHCSGLQYKQRLQPVDVGVGGSLHLFPSCSHLLFDQLGVCLGIILRQFIQHL